MTAVETLNEIRARDEARTDRKRPLRERADASFVLLNVDVLAMESALWAVLEVHQPIDAIDMARQNGKTFVCTGCGTDDGNWQRWPCPTVRAIESTLSTPARGTNA